MESTLYDFQQASMAMHQNGDLFRRKAWPQSNFAVFARPADTIKMELIPVIKSLPDSVKKYLSVVEKTQKLEEVYFRPYICGILDGHIFNGHTLTVEDTQAKDWYRVTVDYSPSPEELHSRIPKPKTVLNNKEKAGILSQAMKPFVALSYEHFEKVVILNRRIIERYDALKVDGQYSKAMDIARAEVIEEFLNDKIDFEDFTAIKELEIPLPSMPGEPAPCHSEDPVIKHSYKTKEGNDSQTQSQE